MFNQGSSDAMLMAWNLVDSLNKKEPESLTFDPVCCVEGVEIPRLGFVDDLLELTRSIAETEISCVNDEVFEKQHCLLFKQIKCKVILMNLVIESGKTITLNGEELEIVDEQKYLGTLVSKYGRTSDIHKRIKDCKGVLNEIVEICKTEAIGPYRFKYMFTLITSCFMLKFEHGCEVWDTLSKKDAHTISNLIPNAVKRMLELPRSTPTNAVIHDFGLTDMVKEIELEKMLLTINVLEMDDSRIVKRLLSSMMDKDVPGFCSQVKEIFKKYDISVIDLLGVTNRRKIVKEKVIENEKKQLLKTMMLGSKTDAILTNFCYNGKILPYLVDLPFSESRMIFIFRGRMFPTRVNFAGRWASDLNCVYCGKMDTDEHLFTCWGFTDLLEGENIHHELFYKLDVPMEVLSVGARVLTKMYERLLLVQEDKDMVRE